MADNAVPQIAQDIVEGYKNSDDSRWPTYDGYYLNRAHFVTASQVGNCERWTWFDKQRSQNDERALIPVTDLDVLPAGVTPDGWGYFSRGHNVERWIVDMLLSSDSDWHYWGLGADQVSYYDGYQSGTPDGFASNRARRRKGAPTLLEFKSYDPRSNTYKFPRTSHKMQVQQNIHVASECLDVEIEQAVIYYGDASDYSSCKEFTIERDDKIIQELSAKSTKIMMARRADDMEPEGLYTGQCSLCPFGSQCSDAVKQNKTVTEQARRRRRLADDVFKKRK